MHCCSCFAWWMGNHLIVVVKSLYSKYLQDFFSGSAAVNQGEPESVGSGSQWGLPTPLPSLVQP